MGGALLNPIRYRGYYYDSETGLYYLQSRYYDPTTCRFVNADLSSLSAVSPGTPQYYKNLYAYCDNNPVMRKDDGGQIWIATCLIGALIGVAVEYVWDVAENFQKGQTGWEAFRPDSSWRDYLGAGVGGFISAYPGGIITSAIAGAGGSIASDLIKGNIDDFGDVVESGSIGALSNMAGYAFGEFVLGRKVNQINSMRRCERKSYLLEKIFKNSHKEVNANLRVFNSNPREVVRNGLLVFKYGVYSSITAPIAANIISAAVNIFG